MRYYGFSRLEKYISISKLATMTYFTPDFLNFFADLRENNDRDWFKSQKKRYETAVKKPFEQLIASLIERMQIEDPTLLVTTKDCIFRIHRDTRFSKDKTPYKLHASAAINRGGKKDHTQPGIYIQASDDSFGIFSGNYRPDTKGLRAIREEIISNMDEFQALLEDKNFKAKFGTIQGEKNKRIAKEFREAAEQQPLLFHKQFYYAHEMSAETLLRDDLVDFVMEYYHASRPMSAFLSRAAAKIL